MSVQRYRRSGNTQKLRQPIEPHREVRLKEIKIGRFEFKTSTGETALLMILLPILLGKGFLFNYFSIFIIFPKTSFLTIFIVPFDFHIAIGIVIKDPTIKLIVFIEKLLKQDSFRGIIVVFTFFYSIFKFCFLGDFSIGIIGCSLSIYYAVGIIFSGHYYFGIGVVI